VNDPLIGQVLDGRYKIEKVLGEGGMGIVYKAVHTSLGKALAIKVLRPEVSKNEEIVQRFRQEAQSASQIGHPHIIDISDFGTLPDGSTYFAMEYLLGKSLTVAMAEQRFTTERTIHVVRQLAGALGAAHEIGIVHRDLKPDNVQLIDRGGQKDFVKVLDFGIAKVGGSTSKLTQAGQVFGTPHYMSPEQCAGTNVDHRTDIYAVGVMLYEMATGKVPFDADNLMGILTKHLYETPIAPRELAPPVDVAPSMEAVILKCLQKKPDQRYSSMAELAADLDAIGHGLSPRALTDRVDRPVSGPQTLTGVEARVSVSTGHIEIRKSRTPLFIGIGLAAAAVIGIGAFMMSGSGDDGAQPTAAVKPAPEDSAKQAAAAQPGPAAAQPDPAAAPEAPAPAPVLVAVSSTPANAEVYQDGSLVGNTPYEVNKPGSGQAVKLDLRLEGYESKTITISAQSRDAMNVQLTKKSAEKPAQASTEKKPRKPRTSGADDKKPASAGGKGRTQTEVLDPWD
jgi:eukaryotic-like serine/threonine-protein kinase